MALQPRTTLDEHPKQQNRKATSIRYMYNTSGINDDNCTSYAMKIDNCTIVDATDKTGYVFSGITNIYFYYDNLPYYLTPTKDAPGLTNFPRFYITDFINNHYDELFLTTMQSYVQQSIYVLVQKFKYNEFYCLLNDLFAIQKYISYYGNYQFITPEWTTNQKSTITSWIKAENRKNTRNVDLIDDSMKNFVVDAHITTDIHTDMTDKQFRQLTAQAYKYCRTYNNWFGLQYVPWSNLDPETSAIVYCDHEGIAVTDADYDSTDKDVYTEIWYEYGENRYPIRTIEPITPSIEYRQQQFEEAMRYLNIEGLVTDEYKFSQPGNFLLWFHRVTEMLCTDTVKSLVELMTKDKNEHYFCDDYLNTSIKVLYKEIDFIAICYYKIFNKVINNNYKIRNCIDNSYESDIKEVLFKFDFNTIWNIIKGNIWNNPDSGPDEYYIREDTVGINEGSNRKDLWQTVYEFIPDLFSFDDIDGISSFKYGYTFDMYDNGIQYVHNDPIINKTSEGSIGYVRKFLPEGFEIRYNIGPGYANTCEIIIRTTINFVFWMYLMEPVLQEKTLITIEPFLPTEPSVPPPENKCTCFLLNDLEMLFGWFETLDIEYSETSRIAQNDILDTIHNGKTNIEKFKNSAKCKYTDLLRIYEIYAKVTNDMITDQDTVTDGDTIVTTVLNLKSVQYQPTLASATGYPLIFSYGDLPEDGYTTDRTDIPDLPDTFTENGSDSYIIINNKQQKKLIWIDYTENDNSLFIPILQMDWTIDYKRYLDLNIEPYINNLIDALKYAENNYEFGEENDRVKELYNLFMEQMTRIQNAVIKQFIRIATECCKELVQINNIPIYKLESYLYDELELFDTVFHKYLVIEDEINNFITDNINSIKYVYEYNGNNSDIAFNEMTFYRKTGWYSNVLYTATSNEEKIFNKSLNGVILYEYPRISDKINSSPSRQQLWHDVKIKCMNLSKIYENSIRPTIISDIRYYANAPSEFSWIFANTRDPDTKDLVMSDYDLSNYTDLGKDYPNYTKYKLTE